MRIVSIHVKGFGVLRERTHEVSGPLALFYGANEAGKSTLMGFIRAVLFGFPSRANPAERYEPLAGGAHGGSLTLLDEQGQRILVERYDSSTSGTRRSSAGNVKVTLGDGTTGGEELLNSLLGGLSADLFRSLFAFGLGELQELRTLQSEEISGYLYSAGLGISGSTIMEAEKKLAARADALYKPRGRNQEINRLQKELEEMERTLRRSKERSGDYERLKEEKAAAERSIEELELCKRELSLQLQKLEQASKARGAWIQLKQVEAELAGLPVWEPFPEHAVARLEAIESEEEAIREQAARLQLKQDSLKAKLDTIKLDEDVLKHYAELERLSEGTAVYQEHHRALLELKVEEEQLKHRLNRLIQQIDAGWDQTSLAACPVSIALREQIRNQRELLAAGRVEVQQLEAERLQLQQQKQRLQDACREQEAELARIRQTLPASASRAKLPDGDGQEHKRELQRISREYANYKQLLRDLEHQRERAEDKRKHKQLLEEAEQRSRQAAKDKQKLLVWGIAGLGALLLLWLLSQKEWIAAGIASVIWLGSMGYFVFAGTSPKRSNRSSRSDAALSEEDADHLQKLASQLRQIEEQLVQHAGLLLGGQEAASTAEIGSKSLRSGSGRSVFPATEGFNQAAGGVAGWPQVRRWLDTELEEWLHDMERWRMQLTEQQRLEEKLRELLHSLRQLEQEEDKVASRQQEVNLRYIELMSEWSDVLELIGFNGHLTPDSVLESLQLVEQGQELLRQIDKLEAKRSLLQEHCTVFEQAAAACLGKKALADPVVSLARWKELALQQQSLQRELSRAQWEWSEGEQERLLQQQRFERCQERKLDLLNECFASSGEQLRFHERLHERRVSLVKERTLLYTALEAQVGAAALGELTALLEAEGEEGLSLRRADLEREIAGLEKSVNQLREVNGRLMHEIEKLEQGEELANQLLKLEERRAALGQLIEQYAVTAFAGLLLKRSREFYEKERQPGVLLRASDYLAKLTDGRYSHIKAPFGEQRLVAMKASGETVNTGLLSRGTAEQLYLAMRFALVEEYARKQPLPLILDDILVNFDQRRMENCLELLAELSQRHQIVLFTCHKHVRDAVMQRYRQFQLIEL